MAKGGHGERAEREPITGVWGRSPQRGPGAEPLVGGSGERSPLKLKHFASECSMEPANSPIFLKFGNAKWSSNIVKFCNSYWKMAKKRTISYKVACKKISWSGQRGGIAPCPSLNTPLGVSVCTVSKHRPIVICTKFSSWIAYDSSVAPPCE